MRDLQRVGYFGGTFDPPHLGHEMLAREVLIQLDLDAVMWLLTPEPPHKTDQVISSVNNRLDMLNLVTGRYEEFQISKVDLERSPPYYAVDTVEIIKNQQPTVDLVYIIGEDSLEDLPYWHHPRSFLAAIDQLAVAPRPGIQSNLLALDKKIPGLKKKTIYLSDIMVEISSTLIRSRVNAREYYDHFLIPEVAIYIKNNHLYR